MKTTHPGTRECKIVVINDVLDTRTEVDSPQSAEEAIKNHGQLRLAKHFLSWYGAGHEQRLDGTYRDEPIAVAILQTADRVVVHWHADGDEEAAVARMREVLSDDHWWMPEEGGAV